LQTLLARVSFPAPKTLLILIITALCAWYVDRAESKNRKIPWYLGIVLITTGSILFGCAKGFTMLVFSRILHGISSSILYTVGLAVLVDTVGKNEVGQWMGTAMSCNNIGIIISPLAGGIIYDWAGKKAVFVTMMLFGAFDIALRVLMKEKPRKSLSKNIPTNAASEKLPGCQYKELRQDTFMDGRCSEDLDEQQLQRAPSHRFKGVISLIRSPRLLAALYGCFINECIVASLCAVLPLFVHTNFHWTALPAGLLFLTIAIPALAGPLAGAVSDRLGARWVAVAGFLATAPSLWMLRFVEGDELGMKVLLCGLLTLAGM
jgi:MFS family permease